MANGQWSGGKGSEYRPHDRKVYGENHTRIFGETQLEKKLREKLELENSKKHK